MTTARSGLRATETATDGTPPRSARRYSSPKREQNAAQTRAAVLAAAAELFASRGWAGTGMREVARAAGVSVETIYATFGSKPELLMAALDVAVVGDADAVALQERPEFLALGDGPPEQRAASGARLVRQVNERTAGIGRALREGAATDAQLEERLAQGERHRRVDVARAAQLIAGRRVSTVETDGLWAVTSMEVFHLLIERAGWSARRYEQWIADTVVRLLVDGEGTS